MLGISTIVFSMPMGLGSVNAYLIKVIDGYILVDTGVKQKRSMLVEQLRVAGCTPDNLKLVIITHGDYDHTGNAAYLQREYRAPVAIHDSDRPMLTEGDMFANRENGNALLKWLAPKLMGFGKEQWMKPDISLTYGMLLREYGWDAKVIGLPGHSLGSIGIFTNDGILFCGDTLDNRKAPAPTTLVGNPGVFQAGIDKIVKLRPKIIYPGHGDAFTLADYQATQVKGIS